MAKRTTFKGFDKKPTSPQCEAILKSGKRCRAEGWCHPDGKNVCATHTRKR